MKIWETMRSLGDRAAEKGKDIAEQAAEKGNAIAVQAAEKSKGIKEQVAEKGKGIAKQTAEQTKQLAQQAGRHAQNWRKGGGQDHLSAESPAASEQRKLAKAIDVLSKRDKLGLTAEGAAAAGGVASGVAASGAIAGLAGASTLLGSSTLGSLLGGVFVTTTPLGWVIGSAAACGALGYGIAKLVRSGAKQDQVRKELVQSLSARLAEVASQSTNQQVLLELGQILALLVAAGEVTELDSQKLVSHVEKGSLQPEIALKRIKALAISKGVIEEVARQPAE